VVLVKCAGTHNVAGALTKTLPGSCNRSAWSLHRPYLTGSRTEYNAFFLSLGIAEPTAVACAERAVRGALLTVGRSVKTVSPVSMRGSNSSARRRVSRNRRPRRRARAALLLAASAHRAAHPPPPPQRHDLFLQPLTPLHSCSYLFRPRHHCCLTMLFKTGLSRAILMR